MKVMIDTNVIISAALSPLGIAAQSMYKAMTLPFKPVVCDYIIDEIHRKFQEKFPKENVQLEAFLYGIIQNFEIIPASMEEFELEKKIRDVKDRPILRAALDIGVDYLLTGDKDFLESEIATPKIICPADFLEL